MVDYESLTQFYNELMCDRPNPDHPEYYAREHFLKVARTGDPVAQCALGFIEQYTHDSGIDWYAAFAKQGNIDALQELANICIQYTVQKYDIAIKERRYLAGEVNNSTHHSINAQCRGDAQRKLADMYISLAWSVSRILLKLKDYIGTRQRMVTSWRGVGWKA